MPAVPVRPPDTVAPAHPGVYHAAVLPLLAASGFLRVVRFLQRRSALILMYHGVMDMQGRGQALVNVNQVDLESFRWQLEFLRDRYTVVPLAELIRRIKRNQAVGGLAAITFDDGYLSVYENAAPVLRSMGLPSTVFLIAGCVEHNSMTWYDRVEAHLLHAPVNSITLGGISYGLQNGRTDTVRAVMRRLKSLGIGDRDELIAELAARSGPLAPGQTSSYSLMGWDQVRELQSQGMAFGVHTYSHPNLSKITGDLRPEIDAASELISERLSIPFDELVFCYPDGDYNKAVRDHVEATGLLGAAAVINALTSPDADPYALPRVAIAREHSQATFYDATVGFTRGVKNLLAFVH